MAVIKYTHFFEDFDSSLVDSVAFDEPTGVAYVDLNDSVYRYDKVTLADVEALVKAPSVGRAYNGNFMTKGFKQKFGPGTFIDDLYYIEYEKREKATNLHSNPSFSITSPTSSNAGGDKNLTYAANAVVDGKPVSEQRVSLKPEPVASVEVDPAEIVTIPLRGREQDTKQVERKFTVHFESNGPKTYNVEGTDFDAAIAKLQESAEILGVDVKVTGVFLHLV